VKRGDIVFVQSNGIIGKLIRYFDSGTFTHCAIAISNFRVIEADYDTKVAVRPFEPNKYDVVEVIDLGLTLAQRRRVYNSAMSYVGKKYDYVSLIWYMLRKVFKLKGLNRFNNPNYMICSELVYLVLDEIGILDELDIKEGFNRGIDFTPNELYDLVKYVSKK
jgi:hypothetical protein